jgi:X-Pro dipeptidyl-peptidase (S15 family)
MKKTIVVTAAMFLAGTAVCLAQPPGVTREMISRALPLEGAPKAEPGPYMVTSEPAFGSPALHIFRPAALDAFPSKDTLPVMVWGNGGCAIDSTHFSGFLSTIASHGVLVIGTVSEEGAARRQETADDMRSAIDWAEKENARAGSPLNGKIAVDRVAVMGTSCGGFLSLVVGADPRVETIGVFNSGVQTPPAGQAAGNAGRGGPSPQPTADALSKLHGPVLLLNGGEPDFLMGASAATFEAINHLPAFYGARHNAGHSATYFHPGGGEFANVASNWLLLTFKGDKKAAKMFVGKDCGLCTNSNWDVKSKGIE